MEDALEMLRLEDLYRYPVITELESPNWKIAADGYVDGYHIGYLHSTTIGLKAITNRNTYDFFGPHVRIGFANKLITTLRDLPEDEWPLAQAMSMVHYVFPNISISGQPSGPLMVSRLLPGPTPDRSTTVQYHYYRAPVEGEEATAMAEARRKLYADVTGDEDFATGFKIMAALDALGDDSFRYGRNERGNQNFHRWIARRGGRREALAADGAPAGHGHGLVLPAALEDRGSLGFEGVVARGDDRLHGPGERLASQPVALDDVVEVEARGVGARADGCVERLLGRRRRRAGRRAPRQRTSPGQPSPRASTRSRERRAAPRCAGRDRA